MRDVMLDRRSSPRFPLIVAAQVTEVLSGAQLTARTSDISRRGCYIDTLNPVPVGSQIRVRLSHGNETFEVYARVVYISPGLGMGVAFDNQIPAAQLTVLDRWLDHAARVA